MTLNNPFHRMATSSALALVNLAIAIITPAKGETIYQIDPPKARHSARVTGEIGAQANYDSHNMPHFRLSFDLQ